MRSYWNFLSTYRTLLGFCLVTALSSSFGQTFFISLFLPFFVRDFGITEGDFGLLYGACTLASALCLPFLGARIDVLPLRNELWVATSFGLARHDLRESTTSPAARSASDSTTSR